MMLASTWGVYWDFWMPFQRADWSARRASREFRKARQRAARAKFRRYLASLTR